MWRWNLEEFDFVISASIPNTLALRFMSVLVMLSAVPSQPVRSDLLLSFSSSMRILLLVSLIEARPISIESSQETSSRAGEGARRLNTHSRAKSMSSRGQRCPTLAC